MTRRCDLVEAEYDVIIIGGGMAGAGVARDLALRGLAVALVEKDDFGSGTTSRSSRLIHGGLRYLALFDFGLVRESLCERETLRRLAPHLIKPLPFLLPVYPESSRSALEVRLGLRLYDWLTPGRTRNRYRMLHPPDALNREPSLNATELKGAGYYSDDLLISPERLCLENVLSSQRHGAHTFNHAAAEEVVRDSQGRIRGVRVRDQLTGQVLTLGARILVNAAGPWVDRIRDGAGIQELGPRIVRTTKGIHCLLPRLTDHAVYHSTSDARMIFIIPWREFSLVGTTDTDFEGDLDRLWATAEEVAYLLGEVRKVVPDPRVEFEQVAYTYAGVRPLSYQQGKRASEVSRAHKIVEEEGGTFLSITGTKLTCFRSLAARLGDRVSKRLGRFVPGRTQRHALDGTDREIGTIEQESWLEAGAGVATGGLARDTLEALVSTHGRAYRRLIDLSARVPGGRERLCPENPEIVAELYHAVQEEMAVSLQDVLLRRTGIGTSPCQGLDCAPAIGRRMAGLLGWTPQRLEAELDAWWAHVALSHRFRD